MARDMATPTQAQIKLGSAPTSNRGLWIAVTLGVVAAIANMAFVSRVQGNRVTVLKAKMRLPAGSKVTSAEFQTVSLYGDDLKQMKSLVVEQKDLPAFTQIPLAESVEVGQILLQSSFAFGGPRGIRDSIGADERAIALHVKDEWQAVAYFVRPGDVVDVWVNDKGNVQNVLTGATVRAVGDATVVPSDAGGRDVRYRTVTIVVKAADVKEILSRLTLAKDEEVTLTLAGTRHS
jgi:Flp pilus assembly protein CpaB